MADFVNIKRKPKPYTPLYNEPEDDTCHDHCITLNDEDLTKLGADLPKRGDKVHVSVMGTVVGIGDDHGHRYVRVEVEDVLFVEDETKESEEEAEGKE
jgi:hypothetical protein